MKIALMLLMCSMTLLPFAAQADQAEPVISIQGCSDVNTGNSLDDIQSSTVNFQQQAAAKCSEQGYPYQETVTATWVAQGNRPYACLVGQVRCER